MKNISSVCILSEDATFMSPFWQLPVDDYFVAAADYCPLIGTNLMRPLDDREEIGFTPLVTGHSAAASGGGVLATFASQCNGSVAQGDIPAVLIKKSSHHLAYSRNGIETI